MFARMCGSMCVFRFGHFGIRVYVRTHISIRVLCMRVSVFVCVRVYLRVCVGNLQRKGDEKNVIWIHLFCVSILRIFFHSRCSYLLSFKSCFLYSVVYWFVDIRYIHFFLGWLRRKKGHIPSLNMNLSKNNPFVIEKVINPLGLTIIFSRTWVPHNVEMVDSFFFIYICNI